VGRPGKPGEPEKRPAPDTEEAGETGAAVRAAERERAGALCRNVVCAGTTALRRRGVGVRTGTGLLRRASAPVSSGARVSGRVVAAHAGESAVGRRAAESTALGSGLLGGNERPYFYQQPGDSSSRPLPSSAPVRTGSDACTDSRPNPRRGKGIALREFVWLVRIYPLGRTMGNGRAKSREPELPCSRGRLTSMPSCRRRPGGRPGTGVPSTGSAPGVGGWCRGPRPRAGPSHRAGPVPPWSRARHRDGS